MNQPAKRYTVLVWERDGLAASEANRARLLDLLEDFARRVYNGTAARLVAGGETALLTEVGDLRPDLQALLAVYNHGGRLSLGPWYRQPAARLVSGEALVRNLLAARDDAGRYGVELASVAFMPAVFGYPAQFPQVLCSFGIDTVVGTHDDPRPAFRWQGPDGSSLLVVNLNNHKTGESGLELRVQTLSDDHQDGEYAGLEAYVEALRQAMPDSARPAVEGEPGCDRAAGILSARLYIKQTNARLQAMLTHSAEPLLALALSHGQLQNPDNLRALLRHGWRLLLQNQTPEALGGTAGDPAHAEQDIRARQVEEVGEYIIGQALAALPGRPARNAARTSETYVVVWNPHNWQTQQAVTVPVELAEGHYPMRLLDAEDREVPYTWADGSLHFVADVPPVGYTTYILQLTLDSGDLDQPARTPGTSITSAVGDDKLLIANEQLIWRHLEPSVVDRGGQVLHESRVTDRIVDLLRFFDGGDAGDTFSYQTPDPDVMVQAHLLPTVEVETTRIYQRLILQHRLRLTPALNEQRGRVRGVKPLDLTTHITMYHHLPGMYFQTRFENTVRDHRLRAHIRTGLNSSQVLADAAFGLARRPISGTQPMHSLCAVDNGKETLALLARGLLEYEAIAEDGQVTLALALLRAVGWRGRPGLPLTVPDAQCLRPMTADYALRSLPAGDPAAVLRAGQTFCAPLRAYHYHEMPPMPTQSYLVVEGDSVVMTALKPPESGAGWIVRLLNPTGRRVEAHLHTASVLQAAQVVNMAEEHLGDLSIANGSRLSVTLEPQQILTLRLVF